MLLVYNLNIITIIILSLFMIYYYYDYLWSEWEGVKKRFQISFAFCTL